MEESGGWLPGGPTSFSSGSALLPYPPCRSEKQSNQSNDGHSQQFQPFGYVQTRSQNLILFAVSDSDSPMVLHLPYDLTKYEYTLHSPSGLTTPTAAVFLTSCLTMCSMAAYTRLPTVSRGLAGRLWLLLLLLLSI